MKRIALYLVLLLIKGNAIYGQSLLTVLSFEEEWNTPISSSSCILFYSDSIAIYPNIEDGDRKVFSITYVNKLLFSETLPNSINNTETTNTFLYPNPAKDFLIIEMIEEDCCQLSIYTIMGGEVMHLRYCRGDKINISSLAPGEYLVRNRNKTCKFIKR